MTVGQRFLAASCVLISVLASRPAEAQAAATSDGARCPSPAPFIDPPGSAHWTSWGVGVTNTRFQPGEQARLTIDQVPKLKLKWAFGFPGAGAAYAQPMIAGGRLFVGSQNGSVFALDAKSGCTYWTFMAAAGVRSAITLGTRKVNGREAYTLYFGDIKARVYALDAATGDLLWARKLDDHQFARVTGAPTLFEGKLYVPLASFEEPAARNPRYECCTFRGSLVALDAESGAVAWKTYTISEEPRPLGKTTAGTERYGPSGAGVWGAPTIDARRRVVYIATGNMYTEPTQRTSDAVMAIDLASGKVKWTNQLTPKDVWVVGCDTQAPNCPAPGTLGPDFDFGQGAMLTTVNGRDMLVIGQKSGIGWALDPARQGAVAWQYRAGRGSTSGGMHFGSALDGEQVYFPVSDASNREPGAVPGGLHAVRLDTGQRVWYTPPPPPKCGTGLNCNGAQSNAITVIPGVVFSGSFDGAMRAFSSKDGAIVWEFDTNREFDTVNGVKAKGASIGGNAGPVVVDGMVYVSSGYDGPGGRPGNVLLAFGVE